MSTDSCLDHVRHAVWLADGPLAHLVKPYIEALRGQRYAERTVVAYVSSLAHFNFWLQVEGLDWPSVGPVTVKEFLQRHLPVCHCPAPCRSVGSDIASALKHLLNLLPPERLSSTTESPISIDLERFGTYLSDVCGVASSTRDCRVQHVGAFLKQVFGTQAPATSTISVEHLEAFIAGLSSHLGPASLRAACNSLRSYFRYRALLGESTAALSAALPRIADWRRTTLPKVLSDAELVAFLAAFNRTDPVGQRDYAIARCLVDLGLRGHEVTYLTLESVDWRGATLTISGTKSKRVQQLPLPVSTGDAIAQYLHQGRPKTINRALFVRHKAPFDTPLSVPAIRNSMNRAFVRCGLRDRFCNTHVLRRTTATRLQRAGASVKEIADLLRHQSLDTASTYARVDLEALRAVALPWPGSSS